MPRLRQYMHDDPSGQIMVSEYSNSNIQDELEVRQDLHFVDGSSDKVYIGILVRRYNMNRSTVTYIVGTMYGRNGRRLTANTKEFDDAFKARQELTKVVSEKTRKGYNLVHSEDTATKGNPDAAALVTIRSFTNKVGGRVPSNSIEFATRLTDESYILEEFSDFVQMVFLKVKITGAILIADKSGNHVIETLSLGSPAWGQVYEGTVMYGYQRSDGSYAIVDLMSLKNQTTTISRSWKERRSMLSAMFADMTESVDWYSRKLRIHLNEYYYQDKDKVYSTNNDNSVHYMVRNIEMNGVTAWMSVSS